MSISVFAKLTDLPEGHEQIVNDFSKRYYRTYMVLNGEIVLIQENTANELYYDKMIGGNITRQVINIRDINSLEIFLPEIGYYNTAVGLIYIYKQPKRQWQRSFSRNIYAISFYNNRADNIFIAESIYNTKDVSV